MTTLMILLLACTGKTEGEDTSSGDGGGTTTPTVPACDDGLPIQEWRVEAEDTVIFSTAASVTLPTEDGDLVLSEIWDGCDVFLFLQDSPRQADADDWPKHLWERDVDELFERLPPNTVLFLGSDESDAGRPEAIALMKEEVQAALDEMDEAEREWWSGRIHWIDGRYQQMEGWLGDLMGSPGWGMVIDREQRLRFVGSYADASRYLSSAGWFEPNVSMAANEAIYANFLAERSHRLANDGATVVRVWDKEPISDGGWAGVRGEATVELPDAATMATFDTLELDLDMGCSGDGEYGECPAWDYLVYMYVCDEGDPTSCNTELGRWITTYHREGRYVHDATPLLPLLASGGTRTFQFYTTQLYDITMDLRFRNTGAAERPTKTTQLFLGAWFDAAYNDNYAPMEVEIPSTAKKVELATIISGHGQVSPGNCAEFCVTEHHFNINGTDNVIELSDAGTESGCMDKVDQGVVPNQYGTWWYGRSGWCPGWEVPVERIDVTEQVTAGSTATIEYTGFQDGEPYTGSGANIVMTSWLTIYE